VASECADDLRRAVRFSGKQNKSNNELESLGDLTHMEIFFIVVSFVLAGMAVVAWQKRRGSASSGSDDSGGDGGSFVSDGGSHHDGGTHDCGGHDGGGDSGGGDGGGH